MIFNFRSPSDAEVIAARGNKSSLNERISGIEKTTTLTDIELNALTQAISQQGSPYLDVNGYGTLSLPKNAAQAAMQSEVEGATATNLVVNGDFSNGTTGWSSSHSTLSVSGNVLTVTGNGTANFSMLTQNTLTPYTAGNKIYVKFRARVTNSDCTAFALQYTGTLSGSNTETPIQTPPTANTWYDFSRIITLPADKTGNLSIRLYHLYASAAAATGKVMEIDRSVGILAINLTALSLDTLTQAQCDAMFATYFSGTKSSIIAREVSQSATGVKSYRYNEPSEYYLLPNGVCDYRDKLGNKKVRVKKYVLTADNITGLNTYTLTNRDYAIVAGIEDADLWTSNIDYKVYIDGYPEISYAGQDTSNTKCIYTNFDNLLIMFPKGTYANLAAAKAALAGTVIYYQLAADKEYTIPQVSSGVLNSYPNGTYYMDYAVTDAGVYTDKAAISRTAYPIKEIESLYKYNADGTLTQLTASSAVIAGDKLSFTHAGLANKDVWFGVYKFDYAAPLPNAKLSPVNNDKVIPDTTNGKFYQLKPTITNGVLQAITAWTLTEV